MTITTNLEDFAFADGIGIDTSPTAVVHTEPRMTDSVLVSGGSRGIGKAIVAQYVADNIPVVSLSRSGTDTIGDGYLDLFADIASQSSIDLAVKRAVEAHGPITTLVCNAGVTDDQLFLRMPEDSFQHLLDTNLTGSYRLAKSVIGPMLRARRGRIIFLSSVVATSGSAGQVNYAASKSGLIGMARSMAREFGPRNITCNVITPGFIDTDMTAAISDARKDDVLAGIPLGRFGTPQDVARVVQFLSSSAAGYSNGAVIPVDGGLGMGH